MWLNQFGYGATNAKDALSLTITPPLGKNKTVDAKARNIDDALMYFSRACELYCSRFRWEGDILEKLLIQDGYIETLLLNFGFCVAAIVEGAYKILPATVTKFNDMGMPTHYNLLGFKEQVLVEVKADDCVVIPANPRFVPTVLMLKRFSGMVADLNRTFEVYAGGLKKSLVFYTDQDSALTDSLIAEQILDNNFYIKVSPKKDSLIDRNPPVFHNTGHNSQDLLGILKAKDEIFAEMNKNMGIRANPQNSKAYTSETEVENHNSEVELTIKVAYECRLKAAEKMSALFGSKIDCINVAEEIENEKINTLSTDNPKDKGE